MQSIEMGMGQAANLGERAEVQRIFDEPPEGLKSLVGEWRIARGVGDKKFSDLDQNDKDDFQDVINKEIARRAAGFKKKGEEKRFSDN
ncbi:MAG: hypothetical protein V1821_02935 [bacterium]